MNDFTKTEQEILDTEYFPQVDTLCKNRMIVSFFKYGPVKKNYEKGMVKAVEEIQARLDLYKKTHNLEYLLDIRNFAMIEFKYPTYKDAHFTSTDNKDKLVSGTSYKEIERLSKGEIDGRD
jgi:hypothetical protein